MKTLIAALLLALAPAAEDKAIISVKLKDGRTARVQVLEVADGKAHLKVFALGGYAEVRRDLEVFEPHSAYRIEVEAMKAATFEEHFKLAKRAAEYGLVSSAGSQLEAAVESLGDDPDAEAKRSEVRAWAADEIERHIQEAVRADDGKRAAELYRILVTRLPEQRSEEQLAALADSVDTLERRAAVARQDDLDARLAEREEKELLDRVEPIKAKAAAGDKHLKNAYASSANTRKSEQMVERAIADYKAAWKMAQELARDYAQDDRVQEAVVDFGHRLERDAIKGALHAASVLTTQTDYHGATEWVNRILAFDPDNAEAKEMLKHIQLASAASGGWRWRWRGR